jgi:hypothetical protein
MPGIVGEKNRMVNLYSRRIDSEQDLALRLEFDLKKSGPGLNESAFTFLYSNFTIPELHLLPILFKPTVPALFSILKH